MESWVLLVDQVKAFGSVLWGVLCAVLAKMGVPLHLFFVIKRKNVDLKAAFELNGEPVEVPWTVGVNQGCLLSPTLLLFVIHSAEHKEGESRFNWFLDAPGKTKTIKR